MRIAGTLIAGLCSVALGTACTPKTETNTQKVETRTETTPAGEVATQKTELEQKTAAGTTEQAQETYVGVVTEYKAGDSLALKLVNGENETFDLDDKGVAIEIGPSVRVGSKVEVTVNKIDGDKRQIRVFPTA